MMRDAMKTLLLFLCSMLVLPCMAGEKVEYVSEQNGVLTFEVTVFGRKSNIERQACDKVMRTVLFRGVSGSNYASRAIAGNDEETIVNEHRKWFDNLFKKDYTAFITMCTPLTAYGKDAMSGKKGCTVRVKIDARSLRRALEAEGIIRRFGY